jgi:ArsR family transcriptional regulator
MALGSGELCVCQVIELLDLAPSTVSKHMSILKQARLVESTKNGKWVYYRLAVDAPLAAREAIAWARKHLVSESTIEADAQNLRGILKQLPVEVCKKQKESRKAKATVLPSEVAT